MTSKQTIRMGGLLSRYQDDMAITALGSYLQFLSSLDFLLDMSATQNGTNRFSNVLQSGQLWSAKSNKFGIRQDRAQLRAIARNGRT